MNRRLSELLHDATERLRTSSPSPRLDAEVLLMHACRLNRTGLITHAQDTLPPEQQACLLALLERRAQGVPVAYLTGEREFWSMPLKVTTDTLVPRPETELLVEQALALIPVDEPWRIADLGTGSGAIALAIARERPRCHLIATDFSEAALAVARENARRHAIGNIEFRQGSWALPLLGETVEMTVSNPPYIREHDPHLAEGDVRFEPRLALTAGVDGLQAIREIAHDIKPSLKRDGWLMLEHGFDQASAVGEILRSEGYGRILCRQDLACHDRISLARRRDD